MKRFKEYLIKRAAEHYGYKTGKALRKFLLKLHDKGKSPDPKVKAKYLGEHRYKPSWKRAHPIKLKGILPFRSEHEKKELDKAYDNSVFRTTEPVVKTVRVRDLRARQRYIDGKHLNRIKNSDEKSYNHKPGELPNAVQVGKTVYVNNGHHRILKQMLKGKKRIRMNVDVIQ